MSKVTDSFFGGAERKAGKKMSEAARRGQDFIREGVEQARGDIMPLFDSAQQNRQMGGQAALDIFGAAVPEQARVFGLGNVGAQQVIGDGAQQYQNAILGNPVNYSFARPQQIEPDFSFMQNQMPDFQTSQQALGQGTPEPQQGLGLSPELQELLAQGGGRFNNKFGGGY